MDALRKVLIACAATSVLGWLVWDQLYENNSWRDAQFIREVALELPAQVHEQLVHELRRVTNSVGSELPIRINAPYQQNALNIYITRSSAAHLTGCRPGDARYDASRDIVLIDEGVVWPLATSVGFASIHVRPTMGNNRENSPKVWLHFALLHELGHRSLHRSLLARLTAHPRSLEDEADTFAFSGLERLAADGEYDSAAAVNVLRVSHELDGVDRSAAEMAALVQQMSVTLLFGGSHFSPYHSDVSHAAFVARFRPRLIEALSRARWDTARTYVLLALAYLDRVEEAAGAVVGEIYSALPLSNVSFINDNLTLTTAVQEEADAQIFRLPTTLFTGNPNASVRLQLPNNEFPGETSNERDPQESIAQRRRVILASEGGQLEWRLLDVRGKLVVARADRLLHQDIKNFFGIGEEELAGCETDLNARESRIDVSFSCRDSTVWSGDSTGLFFVGELDPKTLQIVHLDSFYGPRRAPGDRQRDTQSLLDMHFDGEREVFVVTDTLADHHTRRFELRISRLGLGAGPVIASRALTVDWIPTGGQLYEWLRVSHPGVISCTDQGDGLATCTEFLDSVFLFDARSGSLSTLFYPAAALMTADDESFAAFYAPGGHKVFVVDLESRRKTGINKDQTHEIGGE